MERVVPEQTKGDRESAAALEPEPIFFLRESKVHNHTDSSGRLHAHHIRNPVVVIATP
jgi:hypothetical protein